MTLYLLDALHRTLIGQHDHAQVAGIRISLAFPDCPEMLDRPPAGLSRALAPLMRAVMAAMPPDESLDMHVDIVTSEVVQISIAGRLRPGTAIVAPSDDGLGGLELPASARRSIAMVARRGGRVEDRSSAAAGRIRLVVRLPFNQNRTEPAQPPEDDTIASIPARPHGRPRR